MNTADMSKLGVKKPFKAGCAKFMGGLVAPVSAIDGVFCDFTELGWPTCARLDCGGTRGAELDAITRVDQLPKRAGNCRKTRGRRPWAISSHLRGAGSAHPAIFLYRDKP